MTATPLALPDVDDCKQAAASLGALSDGSP